jgi:drug/metabolite transporter (DMT)-like permease
MRHHVNRAFQRLYGWPRLLLTLTCLFWAGNTIAGRLAVGHVKPMTLTLLRWLLVVAVLWPIYGPQVRAHWPSIARQLPRVALMAALGFTGFNALYYVAAHYTTAINIGILQGCLPMFVLAGAFLAHGTRASPVQVIGALITTLGVVVIATRGAPVALLYVDLNWGDVLMLIACVLYAFFTVALRDRPDMPGVAFFTLLALIAALTSLPLAVAEAILERAATPTWQGLLIIAYVAIFPSCLAQIFLVRSVDLIGPGRAGIFLNLVPLFSAIMAVVLLGEPFAWFHAVALVLVVGGILMAQLISPRAADPAGGN